MTRTIQTAINGFSSILHPVETSVPKPEVQIWPDLREAHGANCNKGLSNLKAELSAKFPQLNFTECPGDWNYPPHNINEATKRAERVQQCSKEPSKMYHNIAVITHRGFIAFLVQGDGYEVCEMRSYRFATNDIMHDDEAADVTSDSATIGVNVDTMEIYDFGRRY
ncbi:hypothetical protein AOL_s00006g537 [Orbilia oligospora ATCC 24927]|uniref:Uncharacterized protein n=1 Tax=Arthrobotrys oligospora (strain ATCC 24927 / CBS 115.81 / DSM 1491) TaxID=756982 RepID=G1X0Y6_ARTOA|nr:hypothetical protein AOL_s00006g537 [Orbilia oligospora ATCC 24927]EGX53159.1 hypothetical protein AOL_s00006g537 [Orbilia oligospora ATCC 24927]